MVDPGEVTEIPTSLCARLYCRRAAVIRARRAVESALDEVAIEADVA